jgi:hypothetical protein
MDLKRLVKLQERVRIFLDSRKHAGVRTDHWTTPSYVCRLFLIRHPWGGDHMRRSRLSTMCLVTMLFMGLLAPMAMADDNSPAKATVSFGQWQTDPPLDRFPLPPPMIDSVTNTN